MVAREFAKAPILNAALNVKPAARSILPFNQALPEDFWFSLYTFKPKVPLLQAQALAARPLSLMQLEHLRREKRPTVWSEVLECNLLSEEFFRFISTSGRFDNRIRATGARYRKLSPYQEVTTLTEEAATSLKPRVIGTTLNPAPVGSYVNYFASHLQTQEEWENLLALIDNFEGSVADLVKVSKVLAS